MPTGNNPEGQPISTGAAIAQLLMPLVFFFVIMYFFIIRPQKKREKETTEMLNSIKVGDNITTIGGICAKVVGIRDDVLTIEVGKDKVNLVIERWAIKEVEKPISD
ncbi:MAG: preprotein translocase subunit YajC [Xylanivirga thermophila]|jgi:preprotein translocase subunit YajC|uniref:preprotein translocase subunit YajC n=1 Tax=Xylanivirga thermophila TaxID=2496273 RepID=UPI00101E04BC|nr:preprotein translocase subunit YajC [Xylanivirga thermophila]